MNVSRVVQRDLVLKWTPRPVGVLTSVKQGGLVRSKPLLRRNLRNPYTHTSVPRPNVRSVNSDDQTVVDQETKAEAIEEEGGSEESVGEYSGPGASIFSSMKEVSENNNSLAPDLVDNWISVLKQEFTDLGKQLEEITIQNKTTESELEELKSKFMRLNADFDNFRKRSDSQRDQLKRNTKSDIMETLLPLIDNFELAKDQTKPKNEGEEAIVSSFMGLYRQMTDLFTDLGVEVIDCDQKPFDPEFHDAILREPNEEFPDGTVIQELRKGFTIQGKLLRAAMVKVSYSEEVLQDVDLPLEENEGVESTLEIENEENGDEES